MSNLKDVINEVNKNYNFPHINKLVELVKSKLPASNTDIINVIKGDVNSQLMTSRMPPRKKQMGHITALSLNELMQLDIFDMQRYKHSNKINKKMYP